MSQANMSNNALPASFPPHPSHVGDLSALGVGAGLAGRGAGAQGPSTAGGSSDGYDAYGAGGPTTAGTSNTMALGTPLTGTSRKQREAQQDRLRATNPEDGYGYRNTPGSSGAGMTPTSPSVGMGMSGDEGDEGSNGVVVHQDGGRYSEPAAELPPQ